MIDRKKVYDLIDKEREYQIQRWGDLDEHNSIGDFICYMQRYIKNAIDVVNPDEPEQSLRQILKVTALGVACLERHGEEE